MDSAYISYSFHDDDDYLDHYHEAINIHYISTSNIEKILKSTTQNK